MRTPVVQVYVLSPSPNPPPLLGLASGFSYRSQSRSTRGESCMYQSMYGMCIFLKTYRGQGGNSVRQAPSGHKYAVICADTKMLFGVRHIRQKLPVKLLCFHTIHMPFGYVWGWM